MPDLNAWKRYIYLLEQARKFDKETKQMTDLTGLTAELAALTAEVAVSDEHMDTLFATRTVVPDLYHNFGQLVSATVPVQHPNQAAVGAQTVIFCLIEDVAKGDYLDISAQIVLNADPQLQPVVTGRCLWLSPATPVPNFNPTAQNPDFVGCMWASEDINYIPAAGSGKYLMYEPRLRVRWPFDQTTTISAVLSVYAGSDVSAGNISVFPSQTGMQVSRVGPGWKKGVWRGMQADMTLADVEPGVFP